ncbi:hypothetical protein AYI70_g4880 [Smittium culicis]|uniref:Uncharacterized protein n=1 Tax=Smittium culicis TaxID=133412 RepID=A0A1R1XWZ1_9FUNG|nr:hypothetical protein AYI70_g4880 [Smittium culicis]
MTIHSFNFDSPISSDVFEEIVKIYNSDFSKTEECPIKDLSKVADSTWNSILQAYNSEPLINANSNSASDIKKCPFYNPKPKAEPVEFSKLVNSPIVKYIDFDTIFGSSNIISAFHLNKLVKTFQAIEADPTKYNALVICRFSQLEYYNYTDITSVSKGVTDSYFMPPLETTDRTVIELSVKLQLLIRKICKIRPTYAIATGKVSFSALPILLSIKNVIVTEYFSTNFRPLNSENSKNEQISTDAHITHFDLNYPNCGLILFSEYCSNFNSSDSKSENGSSPATYLKARGISAIRYVLNNSENINIRAPELIELGFSIGMVSSKLAANFLESLASAAKCPYPHTEFAITSTISSKYEFQGPSRINPWLQEINSLFNAFDEMIKKFTSIEDMAELEIQHN